MTFNGASTTTFFERHAWQVFAGMSLLFAAFGLGDILQGGATFAGGEAPTLKAITGMTARELEGASPDAARMIDYLVRAGGINLLVLGLLSLVVSLTGLRRGERWAWYAMWLWPLWTTSIVVLSGKSYKQVGPGVPPPVLSGAILSVLSVLALVLSHGKFFRKNRPAAAISISSAGGN